MYIRKRSFLEILLPLTAIAFLGQGTQFIDLTRITTFRWAFLFILFFYLLLNKKILIYLKPTHIGLLFFYFMWCVSTSAWSEVPWMSFQKSIVFSITITTFISAGSLWVVRFGYERGLYWLFFVFVMVLISALFGGKVSDNIHVFYFGLSGSPNNFGFLTAVVTPLIIWQSYRAKENKRLFLIWIFFLILDIYFLLSSYSRSSISTALCVLLFFSLSLSLSKKIIFFLCSFLILFIALLLMPIQYFEKAIFAHVVKYSANNQILISRTSVWQKSYQQALKGGIIGGGFGATIGDKKFFSHGLRASNGDYGREKGNSQFAIVEETGIVGLMFFLTILVLFYNYAIPCYRRLIGHNKVLMGLLLGVISGLLLESLVEAWWDSLGPEVICFWTFVGIVIGIVFLEKNKNVSVYKKIISKNPL